MISWWFTDNSGNALGSDSRNGGIQTNRWWIETHVGERCVALSRSLACITTTSIPLEHRRGCKEPAGLLGVLGADTSRTPKHTRTPLEVEMLHSKQTNWVHQPDPRPERMVNVRGQDHQMWTAGVDGRMDTYQRRCVLPWDQWACWSSSPVHAPGSKSHGFLYKPNPKSNAQDYSSGSRTWT